MNKRRWVAIGLAVVLCVVSIFATNLTKQRDMEQLSRLNEMLYGSGQIGEEVEEQGTSGNKIAHLTIEGTILNDGTSGLFSTGGYNHQVFLQQLDTVANDDSVKGIFLEVNSPGGSVYETAEITKKLNEIQTDKKIPVYVAMAAQAASGGYYVSANADKIYASEETMTGSIGVIMSNLNYSGLLEEWGITDATIKSGALKDIGSSTRAQTDQDREVLQAYVDSSYNRFVNVVAQGRDMTTDQVKEIADGRIYDGAQAKENGLIDEIGYPDEALAALKSENKLRNATVVTYDDGSTDFVSTWLGNSLAELQGIKPSQSTLLGGLVESIGTPQSPKAMYLYGGE